MPTRDFSQGSRAPTSIELGCADPSAPCSLPNSLSSDPPLQQVVTDTWEAGLRGKPEIPVFHNLSWNVGAFRDENHNDILFIAAPEIGTGYFQNFAKTLREGFDADLDGRVGPVTWGLDWTFLSATYQSVETLDGSANNTNSFALQGYPGLDGTITVHPGNRIPLIPKQTGKAYAIWQATRRLMFEMNEVIASSSYARGNENNAYTADGVYYLGPGVSPGYAITNFRAHYDLDAALAIGASDRQPFQPRILHRGVDLEYGTDRAGRHSVPAVPRLHHRSLRRKRTGAKRHVLLAWCAAPGLGRIKVTILIVKGSQLPVRYTACIHALFFQPPSAYVPPAFDWRVCANSNIQPRNGRSRANRSVGDHRS